MKPTSADAVQLIDERIAEIRKDIEAIRLSQFSKSEALDELLKLREKLAPAIEAERQEALTNNLTAMGLRRGPGRGKGAEGDTAT